MTTIRSPFGAGDDDYEGVDPFSGGPNFNVLIVGDVSMLERHVASRRKTGDLLRMMSPDSAGATALGFAPIASTDIESVRIASRWESYPGKEGDIYPDFAPDTAIIVSSSNVQPCITAALAAMWVDRYSRRTGLSDADRRGGLILYRPDLWLASGAVGREADFVDIVRTARGACVSLVSFLAGNSPPAAVSLYEKNSAFLL